MDGVNSSNAGMNERQKPAHDSEAGRFTGPCSRFRRDHADLAKFVGFISAVVLRMDETTRIASKALYESADDAAEKEKYRKTMEGGAGVTKILRRHRQLLLQMILCRGVDNYLAYVSELVALVFRTKPETMRSNEEVRLDVVLQHDNMEALVSSLAERRVYQLSYRGMRELSQYLSKRLRFNLFEEADTLKEAIRIIELRNIIVHNRAVVNRQFQSRVPDFPVEVGDAVKLEVDLVLSDVDFIVRSVLDIDQRARQKFELPLDLEEFEPR